MSSRVYETSAPEFRTLIPARIDRMPCSPFHPKMIVALGASLMISQLFLYNAVSFTYTLALTKHFSVNASNAPAYPLAFAAANLFGPLSLINRTPAGVTS
jgi:hypothetical protein